MSRWDRVDVPRGELALAPAGGAAKKGIDENDPLAAVLALGNRAVPVGAVLGILFALLTHGAGAARAMMSLHEMYLEVQTMRAGLHDYFWTMYDVDLTPPEKPAEKPPEPDPPAPEPEPVAIPAPKLNAEPPKEEDPYEPPPAPAQAAKIITAPEDPAQEKIEDLTDQGFVSGDGTGPGYGVVSAQGTASAPTWSPHAKVGGVPGGKGTGAPQAPPPPAPVKDLSKVAGLVGSTNWSCPFPPEADAEQIDSAVVTVVVTVRPDGTPQSVKVISDPGHGFGRQARACALGKRYTPGLDRAGNPVTQSTPPIRVSFVR
jgi:protein TonB